MIKTVSLQVYDEDELVFDGYFSAYPGDMGRYLDHLTNQGLYLVIGIA
jgi:hypothetical protein